MSEQREKILNQEFYARPTETVARDLLGKILTRVFNGSVMKARIVEVEAYNGIGDPASHACNGPTPRCSIMFGKPGVSYVYLNYGIHSLLNIVTRPEGMAGAVLLRAVEPVVGLERMMANRPVLKKATISNGPGKLTQALQVGLSDNGLDMTRADSGLYVLDAEPVADSEVCTGPRIGISAGTDLALRYYLCDNLYISR